MHLPTPLPAAPRTAEEGLGQLPADCRLLPLTHGALLVSPGHATFCRLDDASLPGVRAWLDGGPLPLAVRGELERHGFFGAPREAEPETRTVQLQLTNACNLACTYCCTDSAAARPNELTFERFCGVVDEVREQLGPDTHVSLLGGEPLMVPFALQLGSHVLDRGLGLSFATNGLLLQDEDLARGVAQLMDRGALVRVSLSGSSAASCDPPAGVPRFERALKGLHQLARFGRPASVDLMLVPGQIPELARSFPSLRARLPKGTSIALGVLFEAGRENGANLFESRAALEQALDAIAFEGGELISAPKLSPVAPRREGCSCALGHTLNVRSDGALFTCFKMEEQVGDLARERFADAARQVRAHPRPASTLRKCVSCALATLCGGGCRSENLRLTGDADEPACGPWRVRVLSELLAEDRVSALEWSAPHLLAEAHRRGLGGPASLKTPAPPQRKEGSDVVGHR